MNLEAIHPAEPHFDLSVVMTTGLHFCSGCDLICSGPSYCLRCREEMWALDNDYREKHGLSLVPFETEPVPTETEEMPNASGALLYGMYAAMIGMVTLVTVVSLFLDRGAR